jgi:uncharacterized protein with PQ loop repeat
MNTGDSLGWAALVITIIYTCVGLPSQIRRNHLTKSTTGLSWFMVAMLTCTFAVWLAYGLTVSPRNWYIIGANTPGAAFALVMLVQFRIYRRRPAGQTPG